MAEKIPIGGRIIKRDVPIRLFKDPSNPKIVSKGTINISAPEPIRPPKIPTIIPTKDNPNKLFIKINIYKKNYKFKNSIYTKLNQNEPI
tara:strand:+ start:689 stop:955 length:267 start_codon:yes stop_codon:yes gene_type:complete